MNLPTVKTEFEPIPATEKEVVELDGFARDGKTEDAYSLIRKIFARNRQKRWADAEEVAECISAIRLQSLSKREQDELLEKLEKHLRGVQ